MSDRLAEALKEWALYAEDGPLDWHEQPVVAVALKVLAGPSPAAVEAAADALLNNWLPEHKPSVQGAERMANAALQAAWDTDFTSSPL